MRVTPAEYEQLELRAHSLLADVPLHDVWAVELEGGGPGRTISDVRALISLERLAAGNRAARLLFRIRSALGRSFGWDREPARATRESFIHRLSPADRERSLVAPGTPEGAFRTLFVSAHEAISEIQNSTVHAFSVVALLERPAGYRLYWSIYVLPVNRFTHWYMHLIDPFRRIIIYPAMLRQIRSAWLQRQPLQDRSGQGPRC